MSINFSKVIFLINDDAIAIKAQYENPDDFPDTTDYGTRKGPGVKPAPVMFKTLDKSIKKDDYVVVETNTRWGMTVCKVTEVDVPVDVADQTELRWAICRVDRESHDVVLAQEQKAIHHVQHAEQNRYRDELRESLLKTTNGELKTLDIYTAGQGKAIEDNSAPAAPPPQDDPI